MADEFGGITLPIAAPAAGYPVTDAGLKYLGDYLQAVLEAYVATAWAAVAPTESVVKTVYTHDPVLAVAPGPDQLPALFVWRSQIGEEQQADDWALQRSTIRILWLLHAIDEDQRILHTPAFNGIAKVIRYCLFKGRDPNWLVVGDTDPHAATRGSRIDTWCGFDSITVGPAAPVEITAVGEAGQFPFEGLGLEISVTETLERDPTVSADGVAGIEINVGISDEDTGALPGDGFETTGWAGYLPAELCGLTASPVDAFELDDPDCEGRLTGLTSIPGRLDPDTYELTASGAATPAWELIGWNSAYPSALFNGSAHRVILDALAASATGDDQAFSAVMAVQVVAHAAGATLWSFGSSGGATPSFRASLDGNGQVDTIRDDGTPVTAAGTAALSTGRHVIVWSFDGTTLTTHVDGVKELDAVALDSGALTLDTFAIGCRRGASDSDFANIRLGCFWPFATALSDADAVSLTTFAAERWSYS